MACKIGKDYNCGGEEMIVAKNLNKWYGNFHVIRDLELNVNRGEIFGLLGPNGAGKTTLIKILTGQTRARGFALVAGINPIIDPIGVRRIVGIVPETESVPNYLTVREYLHFVAKIRNLAEDRVDEMLKKFDLRDYENKICRELSKGTKQRLMFAAAFIHEPAILFLDEPFINLDPIYQRTMKNLMLNYVKNGGTIFMATHIMEIAQKLCTRIGIMKNGKIAAVVEDVGDVENVFMKVMSDA